MRVLIDRADNGLVTRLGDGDGGDDGVGKEWEGRNEEGIEEEESEGNH